MLWFLIGLKNCYLLCSYLWFAAVLWRNREQTRAGGLHWWGQVALWVMSPIWLGYHLAFKIIEWWKG
jgi:hypothetical protein